MTSLKNYKKVCLINIVYGHSKMNNVLPLRFQNIAVIHILWCLYIVRTCNWVWCIAAIQVASVKVSPVYFFMSSSQLMLLILLLVCHLIFLSHLFFSSRLGGLMMMCRQHFQKKISFICWHYFWSCFHWNIQASNSIQSLQKVFEGNSF